MHEAASGLRLELTENQTADYVAKGLMVRVSVCSLVHITLLYCIVYCPGWDVSIEETRFVPLPPPPPPPIPRKANRLQR